LRRELVLFLEEKSAKIFIQGIIERIPGEKVEVKYIVFDGKNDLDKNIEKRMRGYLNPDANFIVLRDQDLADCIELKEYLNKKCQSTQKNNLKIRIACRELESWFLADKGALEKSYPDYNFKYAKKNYDELQKPSQFLERILPEFQKTGTARTISQYINLNEPKSTSFKHFLTILKTYLIISNPEENL
jgi:hypothetical protein